MTTRSGGNHQGAAGKDLVKITFILEKADWHDHPRETLWAESVGTDAFRVRNVPFYAYGVSYGDTVTTARSGERRIVQGVSERGGHSTYRIFVSSTETLERFPEYWQPLQSSGCTLERATERLLAVDVPPEADIYSVYDGLTKGEAAGVWDFEEAHVGHVLNGQAP